MRLVKIKYRNPTLDTRFSYCINNYLWAKNKVKFLSETEMLVPKFYTARHVSQTSSQRKAQARYNARHPLKLIKEAHEQQQKRRKPRKRTKTEPKYQFNVLVTEAEYKILWNFLYKELRNPLAKMKRIKTIEELMEKRNNEIQRNS